MINGPNLDLSRCETQCNLNDKRRVEARDIGPQFQRLRIPVSEVLGSDFCRGCQAAELMFGRNLKAQTLTGVRRAPEAAQHRRDASADSREVLATRLAQGSNTVLVVHGFNLWDAEGFHLGIQGEAAIVRPLPGGAASPSGMG